VRPVPASVQGLFERLSARGHATHAAVAGAYAWMVTVAPTFWQSGHSGVGVVADIAAATALVALVAGVFAERRWGSRARVVSHWVFVLSSALAWLSAPAVAGPFRVDGPRGLAGMLGWGLFALASAGPALGEPREPGRVATEQPLEARRVLAPGDAAYLAVGSAMALALQLVGWRVAVPERALLVRLVALAAGLAVIGAAAEIGLARHVPRGPRPLKARLRRSRVALAVLGMLVLAGLLLLARD
jgi:hypothetical protein